MMTFEEKLRRMTAASAEVIARGGPGLYHTFVMHDDWCVVMQHGGNLRDCTCEPWFEVRPDRMDG